MQDYSLTFHCVTSVSIDGHGLHAVNDATVGVGVSDVAYVIYNI